jgi:hypothetical protein
LFLAAVFLTANIPSALLRKQGREGEVALLHQARSAAIAPKTARLEKSHRQSSVNLPHRVMRRLPFVDEQKKTRLRSHLSA